MYLRDCSKPMKEILNKGSAEGVTIGELAGIICDVAGFRGKIVFDSSKSDGTPRKLFDSSRLRELGWHPRISLKEGLTSTY